MSGHSKWSKIKRQKGANDAKRGASFTRHGNAIAVAAKQGGADPDLNPSLALAIEKAKADNMPNDNIDRSIKRGTGELGGGVIEEITYEGYGPAGVAILIDCATDNRNRTYSDVRTAFSKNGGNMAETGAVGYLFDRKGVIAATKTDDPDSDQLVAIDAGAEDIVDDDDSWTIYVEAKTLHSTAAELKKNGLTVTSADLAFVPKVTMVIEDEKQQAKIIRLMDVLDELDDVVDTHTNFDIA